jgi:hypothetical protein
VKSGSSLVPSTLSTLFTTAKYEIEIDLLYQLPDALDKMNFIFKVTFRFHTNAGN